MCDFKLNVENEAFGNYVFKKLQFENTKNCLFKSQAMKFFLETHNFKGQNMILSNA
jgi:hypothetical protein